MSDTERASAAVIQLESRLKLISAEPMWGDPLAVKLNQHRAVCKSED